MNLSESDFSTLGKLLIKLQFLEKLIQIYTSSLSDDVKKRHPRIKSLSLSNILDESVANRKQTLGVFVQVIKTELPSFDNEEFQELLRLRNIFVHKLHSQFLLAGKADVEGLSAFIDRLLMLTNKYTGVFTGLLSISFKHMANNSQTLNTEGIDQFEVSFVDYISK